MKLGNWNRLQKPPAHASKPRAHVSKPCAHVSKPRVHVSQGQGLLRSVQSRVFGFLRTRIASCDPLTLQACSWLGGRRRAFEGSWGPPGPPGRGGLTCRGVLGRR